MLQSVTFMWKMSWLSILSFGISNRVFQKKRESHHGHLTEYFKSKSRLLRDCFLKDVKDATLEFLINVPGRFSMFGKFASQEVFILSFLN